jgi:2-polyprenyl-6-methoxyphenol hydroxylase-like FAD-dependent oxidoreductase
MAGRKHAEIAGAGIGGLTTAAALAQCGWTVRVHEKAPHLRDLGVGTSVWQNGHRALAAIGALEEVLRCGTKIARVEVFDEKLQPLRVHEHNDATDPALVILRVDLHRALVEAARRVGVEIVTSSPAVAADPDGTLITENGSRFPADLVIGCDGYYSNVRDSLGVAEEVGFVTDAYIGRVTVPREDRPEVETIREYWAGARRCGVLGCGPVNYIFLSAPENCPHNREEVRSRSFHAPVWVEAFPFLADKLARADPAELIWSRYSIVRCRSWSKGGAVILGDSAHCMPSTLAQGAGCAMANGLALAEAVKDATDIPAALVHWEKQARPITEITQRWAVLYLMMTKRWPQNLLEMRSQMVAETFASPGMMAHFHAAARHIVNLS